jgi:hypothetical protein
METFQKAVLICAIIVLIGALIIIGIALTNAKNTNWPPMIPDCPDYWLIDGSGTNTQCINIKDLGNGKCKPQNGDAKLKMNFNSSLFTGSQGLCNKYKWANSCGVTWDGITYGVPNPCS